MVASIPEYERTMEERPITWAVAVMCFELIVVSIFIGYIIHVIGHWLKEKHKNALYEALEKTKAELVLLGFISLLLTVLQQPISGIFISKTVGSTCHPCELVKGQTEKNYQNGTGRKLLQFLESGFGERRRLATKGYDKCTEKGKVAFMSAYAIHHLHIFIFVFAISHVLNCIATLALGRTKVRNWKVWEYETTTLEYRYSNDPERFRFARDTSFGRRHLSFWSESTISLWLVCFFRQFFRSVAKVDYLTLRHGFIKAHLPPVRETRFDFRKYITRSLEEDFKVVVGISPIIWFLAVLFLLSNTYGWHSYLWLPFLPLIIILVVGAKLQVIITKMGLSIQDSIQDRGDVVKGTPVVYTGDYLFWFGRPRLILFLIHIVLFQNRFQLAFFAWSLYEFGKSNCFHKRTEDIIIGISMGVIVQVLCSYVTLPLYALVTQMGSAMRPTIFSVRVAAALKNWHHTAKRNTKHSPHSDQQGNSPLSSRPATPSHGMSPVHLLRSHRHSSHQLSLHASPRKSNFENNIAHDHYWDGLELEDYVPSPKNPSTTGAHDHDSDGIRPIDQEPSSSQLPDPILPPGALDLSQLEININLSDFRRE